MEKIAQPSKIVPLTSNLGFQTSHSVDRVPDLLKKLDAPLAIAQTLQSTLEINELLELFFTGLSRCVKFTGLQYFNESMQIAITLGQVTPHSLSYGLTLAEETLGTLLVHNASPFPEKTIQDIENILTLLIYPLRNVLYYQRALALTVTDPLTGIGNRMAFDNDIQGEMDLAKRHQIPLTLMVIDADDFKKINDEYGHLAGDFALKHIVSNLQESIRGCDSLFRLGGEEFVVLLKQTDAEGALLLADRMCAKMHRMPLTLGNTLIPLSVSIGVAALQNNDTTHSLFSKADAALYQAKLNGKNQAMLSQ